MDNLTKLAPSIAAVANGLNVHAGVCERHGKYQGYRVGSGEPVCPFCMQERYISLDERAFKARQGGPVTNEDAMRRLGIPRRYLSARLSDLQASTLQKQRAAGKWAATYLERVREDLHEPSLQVVVIHGNPGAGKTHLACALVRALAELGVPARYEDAGRMFSAFLALRPTDPVAAYGMAERGKVLVLDDVLATDSEALRGYVQEVVTRRYDACLPTLLLGNFSLGQLNEYLGTRCVDRLEQSMINIEFSCPSFRQIHSEG